MGSVSDLQERTKTERALGNIVVKRLLEHEGRRVARGWRKLFNPYPANVENMVSS
jgi:hypothetical protein